MRKYYLLVLIVLFTSCIKEKEFDYPLIFMGEVTDIDASGAVFHANVRDISKEGITEYGFVWACNSTPDITSSQVRIVEPISPGVLSLKITNDLLPDETYYVRAFARNSQYITYSKSVSFKSKGSLPPVIHDFYPDHGSSGSKIAIYGENFSGRCLGNKVRFGNIQAVVDSASADKLVVTIDNNVTMSGFVKLFLQVADHQIQSEKSFRFDGIYIIDFTPKELMPNDTLYLTLENYNPSPLRNLIKIGNVYVESCYIKNNILRCKIPYNAQPGYSEVSAFSDGKTFISETRLNVLSPWSVIKGGYKFYRSGAIGFSINGKGYAGMGQDVQSSMTYLAFNDFYEFNPTTGNWTRLASLPAQERQDAIGFSIGNKGYAGLGNNGGSPHFSDLWEYDPGTDIWTQKASYPGEIRDNATCLVIGDKAYVGLGTYSENLMDFWEYNPATDEWRRVADFPGYGGPYIGFCIGNTGYFAFGSGSALNSYSKAVWKYDPQLNEWTRLNDFPGDFRGLPVGFSLNGYGYIGMGQKNRVELKDFWKYNPETDNWIRLPDVSVNGRYDAVSFVLGNSAYITAGFSVEDWQYGNNAESLIVFQP